MSARRHAQNVTQSLNQSPRDTLQRACLRGRSTHRPLGRRSVMPTPSHIVLGLPELILIILENVLPSDKLQVYCRCSARPTLAAAARVCKAWTAPASIVLWRSLDTLVPLLKLLPTAKFVGLDGTDSDSDTDDDLDHDSALVSVSFRHQARAPHSRCCSSEPLDPRGRRLPRRLAAIHVLRRPRSRR